MQLTSDFGMARATCSAGISNTVRCSCQEKQLKRQPKKTKNTDEDDTEMIYCPGLTVSCQDELMREKRSLTFRMRY